MRLRWMQIQSQRGAENPQLAQDISRVFADSTDGLAEWSAVGVSRRIAQCSALFVLTGGSERIYGYAMYVVPSRMLFGQRLLWECSVAVAREAQGIGHSEAILDTAIEYAGGTHCGWLGGRTQNPAVFARYRKRGLLLPFDQTYDHASSAGVLDLICREIPEIAASKVEPATGICRKCYAEGALSAPAVGNESLQRYERDLVRWKFSRQSGDAIVVVANLSGRA